MPNYVSWLTLPLLVLAGCAGIDKDAANQNQQAATNPAPEIERLSGLFPVRLDRKKGRALIELHQDQAGNLGEFLYVESLRTGLGSNPVGLDRGQLGPTRLIRFRRVGDKVLIEEPNLAFRATSDDPKERAAVAESFATSVLWGGPIDSEENGRVLVDLTSFLVRDAHQSANALKRAAQGQFRLDKDRSALGLDATLVFPDNIEFEAVLTFAAEDPGTLVRATAPTPESITLIQHHSLIRLPDAGYTPREFDPRMPSFPVSFADYAAPLDQDLTTRWIARHRLEKTDPSAAYATVKEPITYYVDPGVPEPIRSALIEGASWWTDAFEAAGFLDAFRVELLPENAHPLDVRYNVIQWVHRSTRGWSYGGSMTDPRTGEIIKGHVSLGSLRIRQDRMIFEALAGVEKTGTADPADPIQISLARIRQLAAHEVGHTLGFAHNFAASTYGGRASVMDYPAPWIFLTPDAELDFSQAYAIGIGAWDMHAVRFAYSEFDADANESEALDEIVREGLRFDYTFISDADARDPGGAHPRAHLWDNGQDAVRELRRTLEVRAHALDRFGPDRIREGEPMANLRARLVPLYLFHRYQLEAAIKLVAGLDFAYTVRADDQPLSTRVPAQRQRAALDAALRSIDADVLDLPDDALRILEPRAFGIDPAEVFESDSAPAFDLLNAAASSADIAISLLLHPARAARLVAQHADDAAQLGLAETLDTLIARAFADTPPGRRGAIARRVRDVVVIRLIRLAANPRATPEVRTEAEAALVRLRDTLGANPADAQNARLSRDIDRFIARELDPIAVPASPDNPPPGSPIGAAPPTLDPHFADCAHVWH